jgi:hypothetical protein
MEVVAPGARRARFVGTCVGPMDVEARAGASSLREALDELEALGLSPVLDDGAVAGNAALRLPSGSWLASASARRSGEPAVVQIVRFDPDAFTLDYRSDDPTREPTSDVALHWCALFSFGEDGPRASLHGHALTTDADARRLGVPISERAHAFGTPDELTATRAMLVALPYPEHHVWLRRDHGFLLADADIASARARMRSLVTRS